METGRCYGGGVCVERQKMRAREEKEGMWECYFIFIFFHFWSSFQLFSCCRFRFYRFTLTFICIGKIISNFVNKFPPTWVDRNPGNVITALSSSIWKARHFRPIHLGCRQDPRYVSHWRHNTCPNSATPHNYCLINGNGRLGYKHHLLMEIIPVVPLEWMAVGGASREMLAHWSSRRAWLRPLDYDQSWDWLRIFIDLRLFENLDC